MVDKDMNLDELFTELLYKTNLPDEEKVKYMHIYDDDLELSDKLVLIKLIQGKYKAEQIQRESEIANARYNKRGY